MKLLQRDAWSLFEEMPSLYHGTSSNRLASILRDGMEVGSHYGSVEVAQHFANETCSSEGGTPIIVAISSKSFDLSEFDIDEEMIDFPIFDNWDVRSCAWEELDDGDALDCLRIYEAVIYRLPIPVSIAMITDLDWVPVKSPPGEQVQPASMRHRGPC